MCEPQLCATCERLDANMGLRKGDACFIVSQALRLPVLRPEQVLNLGALFIAPRAKAFANLAKRQEAFAAAAFAGMQRR